MTASESERIRSAQRAQDPPLHGVRVVELGGIGPGPFGAMMLADFGAEVITIDRLGGEPGRHDHHAVLDRGRRSVAVDLKQPGGADVVLELVGTAEVLIEGFRPGVAERLGLGPDACLAVRPQLVYARMTGWGGDGPYAQRAGHDIDYLAVSGLLSGFVTPGGRPVPPLNLLGDFGAGGMTLAFGVLAALLHARATGQGQVVDAAILDGLGVMGAMHQAMLASGLHAAPAGRNVFDGGAPYYRCYRAADDRWLAVGAIEPAFYTELLTGLGLADDPRCARATDPARWPEISEILAARIATRTLQQWLAVFVDLDACVAPVLTPTEAAADPQVVARGGLPQVGGVRHPLPAPRLSVTPARLPSPAPPAGADTVAVLTELGRTRDQIEALVAAGVVAVGAPR